MLCCDFICEARSEVDAARSEVDQRVTHDVFKRLSAMSTNNELSISERSPDEVGLFSKWNLELRYEDVVRTLYSFTPSFDHIGVTNPLLSFLTSPITLELKVLSSSQHSVQVCQFCVL